MKLKKVQIHKYKSFEKEQAFEVEQDISILVGMNESGKTSVLEAIAKTNYFQNDKDFEFDVTPDYPRKEKKRMEKRGENPKAVTCTYEISNDLINEINEDVGKGVLRFQEFSITHHYKESNPTFDGVHVNKEKFIKGKIKEVNINSESLVEKFNKVNSKEDFTDLKDTFKDEKYINLFNRLGKYFENSTSGNNPIEEYISKVYLSTNLPQFLYYDEYYALPSRISIEKLENNNHLDNKYKTAKALFELSDINTKELLTSDNFENYIAELEATEAIISHELFKYWQTNKNLNITFQIDKKLVADQYDKHVLEHILDIRVRNKGVSLPLKNRSKGFNWFFSFIVWFKKIQENQDSNYILLLDEPGLNLHASAQADLLRFIEDLAKDYQIIYTTHSPFMIPTSNLNRVRTILETDQGSTISDSIQEKDPNTLFPLQAALGYDIAQNLFIGKKNLLVEGVSDLTILTAISSILEAGNKESLSDDITIVPTGGLEKVATFISLLRGSELDIVCLLDTYTNQKGKAKMDNMVYERIIPQNKIKFYHDFIDEYERADLEDLFVKSDYLKLFNFAFKNDYPEIKIADLNGKKQQIISQINHCINKDRFNHYRPAQEIMKQGLDIYFFDKQTLDNFEKLFKEINKIFR
ncbi:MAG: AAA family ATPase [Flavobacteriaceae bacterium]|nr:AAA family ATPase [Flavobacteriaceae bacterium]MCY4267015.1 AAA family ATPase [Flavobacteriaceae bacterium]